MNNTSTKLSRTTAYPWMFYRFLLCALGMTVIFCALAIELNNHFTPGNMEYMLLGKNTSVTPGILKNIPSDISEGLYKDEIYMMTQEQNTDTAPSENGAGDDAVFPITETDLSMGAAKGEVLVKDSDSGITVDTAKLLALPYPESLGSQGYTNVSTQKKPLVLILHTHATECFSDEGQSYYTNETEFRSRDTEKNMVSVGKVMTDTLNAKGVPTLHCTTLHDAEDYNSSYPNSLASVKYYLEKYPSIKYVFDVHRDAIIRQTGEALKPICTINGRATAQTMTLVGTDAGGADHPDWQTNNMNLALKLQAALTSKYTGMARPVTTRNASFNQQYAPGSLLFEIGSCANTLDEAKNAAAVLADTLAELIKAN